MRRLLRFTLTVVVACNCAFLGGCIAPSTRQEPPPPNVHDDRDWPASRGFVLDEARDFINFCVELDSQDDRAPYMRKATLTEGEKQELSKVSAVVDPAKWKLVYDSRTEFTKDLFQYVRAGEPSCTQGSKDDDPCYWARDYSVIKDKLKLVAPENVERELRIDPNLNGFGPWQNAWTMYEGMGVNRGSYAIAIRGTVFSIKPSAVEDAVFHPVSGRRFLSASFSFADDQRASVHSGFAHATFTLLMDRRYGIYAVLERMSSPPSNLPADAMIYIVGHSQGAAMATLTHAAMHYAVRDANAGGRDALRLRGRHYQFKSYVFAQPKPGNFEFAADFASFTQLPDSAIVVNNSLDPVPKVPLTLGSTADLSGDFQGHYFLADFVRTISSFGYTVRTNFGLIAEPRVRESARHFGHYHGYPAIAPWQEESVGSSWNFTSAGHVLLVYGTPQSDQGKDAFYQHHSPTYRDLIETQLSSRVAGAVATYKARPTQ